MHANTNRAKLNHPPVTSKDIKKDKIMKLANVCRIMAAVRKTVRLVRWFIVLKPAKYTGGWPVVFIGLFLQIKYSLRYLSFIITK